MVEISLLMTLGVETQVIRIDYLAKIQMPRGVGDGGGSQEWVKDKPRFPEEMSLMTGRIKWVLYPTEKVGFTLMSSEGLSSSLSFVDFKEIWDDFS